MRLDIPGGMHRSEDRFAKHTQTTFAFMHLQFAFHWLHKLHCTLVAYCTRHTDSIAHIAHNAHISHCTLNVAVTQISFEFTALQFAFHQFAHCKLITLHILLIAHHT